MENARNRLIQLIRERSFQMADEPIYKLASGATSRFYFNMKPTAHSPEGLTLIGGLYLDKMDELGIRPDAIGGLTMGADPIAAAVAMTSFARKPPVEAFVIRKEPKKYGMTLQLEGHVKAGDSVVIVDDVVTTGGSTIKAINVAKECGVHILAVIVLLDRCEQNGMENVSAQGCPAYSILNIHDFM